MEIMAKSKSEQESAAKENGAQANGRSRRPRMQRHYEETVRRKLQEQFGWETPMQVPRLQKIVVNCGVGEATKNAKLLDAVAAELALITGQKPVLRRAKQAISNFSLRQGMPIGVSVTLRRERMYEFLDRLINVSIPRIRDFRGLPTRSFDGRGNYTMGVKEQLIFPEIDYDKVDAVHGMDITFVTSTTKDEEGLALLREFGMPFRGEIPVKVEA
jgi:large subunit ribosomal protein L5